MQAGRLTLILFFGIALNGIAGNTSYVDSLYHALKQSRHDSDRVKTFLEIGQYYHSQMPDSASQYYNKALSLSTKAKYSQGTALSYSFLGYLSEDQGNYPAAIDLYKKSLAIFTTLKDVKGVANHYNFIGLAYNYNGDYLNAVEYFLMSMKEYEQLGDSAQISKCLLNLGLAFYNNKDYLKAEKYLTDAAKIKKVIQDNNGLALCYMNLGNLYAVKQNYTPALNFYLKSDSIFEILQQDMYLAYSKTNIAGVYVDQKKYELAEKYFNTAIEICKKINDNNLLIFIKIGLSRLYLKTQRTELALRTGTESTEMARGLGILPYLKDGLFLMSDIYTELKDYENALRYYKEGVAIHDSIYNIDKNKQLQELSTRFETEQKENQIRIQEAKLTASEAETEKAQIQKWAVAITAFLILIVALVILYNYLRNKKSNRLLKEKNEEIEQQKAEIMVIADNLEHVNRELEKLSIVASETDNAVIIASPQGEIEWVNDGFQRLFGYTLNEFRQQFGSSLQTGSENDEISVLIDKSISLKQPITYTTRNKTKSGKTIWTQTTLTPIIKNQEIQKLIAIDTDITRMKLAEEEIQKQKNELEKQRNEISDVNTTLQKKNLQITENIHYAKRIQAAMLPSYMELQKQVPDSFLIFRPRDIVSGDFYWFHSEGNTICMAVADCTGHGVSGAFMSMIGTVLLNEIVIHKKINDPGTVLKMLDRDIRFALNNQDAPGGSDDGMDISFCLIDRSQNFIKFASANQTLCYTNAANQLIIYEGDIWSAGGNLGDDKSFTTQTIPADEIRAIYLGTDGFADQFGGEQGQKFKTKRLLEIIQQITELAMTEQQSLIEKHLNEWMQYEKNGETITYSQTDDICLLGVRLQTS